MLTGSLKSHTKVTSKYKVLYHVNTRNTFSLFINNNCIAINAAIVCTPIELFEKLARKDNAAFSQ